MKAGDPEARLRETLDTLATTVVASPDAYAKARSEWQRRERRRRLVMLVLALVIVVVADVVGLWALNSFSDPVPPTERTRIDVVIQP
ncbi:hypothetical protein [Microtetraspora sp. NBRC 16547]|uniref:hypothetical protein n=1 Tax=Microtetraspora sp. NBRC 16547 TaxID=3030993 RepID=UPI0024A0AC05|nr:hypothetical protein [Microtetraspora sp. NBRC 16547]GLW96632.1 hypothetical protein Misp02_07190 [Microtetraspora sp. NBRC 16547]